MHAKRENRTEDMRRSEFKDDDQSLWQKRSKYIETMLADKIQEGTNFVDVYQCAAKERTKIAQKQARRSGCNPAQIARFGIVRENQYCRRNYDIYGPFLIADTTITDPQPFRCIERLVKNFVRTNNHIYGINLITTNSPRYAVFRELGLDFYASEKTPIKRYAPIVDTSAYEVMPTMYTKTDPMSGQEVVIAVKTSWGTMNNRLYHSFLQGCQSRIEKLRSPDCSGAEALIHMGLLAYALTRAVPLERGSSAVAGWMIRGIGLNKNFELGNLRVQGMPFDIYAHVQPCPRTYVKDFAMALAHDFNLLAPVEFRKLAMMTLDEIEQQGQKDYAPPPEDADDVDTLESIQSKEKQNAGPTSSLTTTMSLEEFVRLIPPACTDPLPSSYSAYFFQTQSQAKRSCNEGLKSKSEVHSNLPAKPR